MTLYTCRGCGYVKDVSNPESLVASSAVMPPTPISLRCPTCPGYEMEGPGSTQKFGGVVHDLTEVGFIMERRRVS